VDLMCVRVGRLDLCFRIGSISDGNKHYSSRKGAQNFCYLHVNLQRNLQRYYYIDRGQSLRY
jgi:hypothetical protein